MWYFSILFHCFIPIFFVSFRVYKVEKHDERAKYKKEEKMNSNYSFTTAQATCIYFSGQMKYTCGVITVCLLFCFYREHAKNGCYTITIINDMLAPSLKREQIFIFRCCCCSCCSKENAAQHKQIESSSKRTIFNPSMIHRNFLKVDQLYKIAAGGLVNPLIAYGIK